MKYNPFSPIWRFIIQEIIDVLDSESYLTDLETVSAYKVCGVTPHSVLIPDSGDDLAKALVCADHNGDKIILGGNWTKSSWGGVPVEADIAISSAKLKRVIDHDPANFTVSVEPGIRLDELNEFLYEAGQFFPLDPPFFSSATLGGVIATNSSGPRRCSYGGARDLVSGLKVSLPDGGKIKVGGKTMKNVAGYDIGKLFIGSWGTLGAIIEATIRVYPLPERGRALICGTKDLSSLTRVSSAILKSSLDPSFIEILDPDAANTFSISSGIEVAGGGKYLLVAGAEGFNESVDRQIRDFESQCVSEGAEIVDLVEEDEFPKVWETLRDLGNDTLAGRKAEVTCRAGLPRAQVGNMMLGLKNLENDLSLRCSIVTHAGSGGVIISFYEEGGKDTEKFVVAIKETITMAYRLGGSLVVEASPPLLKERVDVWGLQGSSLKVMRSIKAQIDPKGTLCAGRFVGGI